MDLRKLKERLGELAEAEKERIKRMLLFELSISNDDEVANLLDVDLHGETHFSVLIVCNKCGYASHIATLSLENPESWRLAVAANAENAIRRFEEHPCAEVMLYGGENLTSFER